MPCSGGRGFTPALDLDVPLLAEADHAAQQERDLQRDEQRAQQADHVRRDRRVGEAVLRAVEPGGRGTAPKMPRTTASAAIIGSTPRLQRATNSANTTYRTM